MKEGNLCDILIPNTHRRRRRRCVLNSQLAHDDCRRKFGNWTCWEFILSSQSCVGGVYAPVSCRDPVYNSAAYMWLAQKIGNWVTTDDWCVHTADTKQHEFVVGKLFRLVETVANYGSCEFNTHRRRNSTRQNFELTQLNSTVELRRGRRCVLGLTEEDVICSIQHKSIGEIALPASCLLHP